MSSPTRPTVEIVEIDAAQDGQRIDNFLIKHMKGVPKTRLYRALRNGEVRVNGSRKKASYSLCIGDKLRLPPLRRSADNASNRASLIPDSLLEQIPVLYEDEHVVVVDKPAGLAVHGGTGLDYGLIEALRKLRPQSPYLELAHRLDRETSGCLMIAKSRPALLGLQRQLSEERSIEKCYVALVKGEWREGIKEVTTALAKPHGGNKVQAIDTETAETVPADARESHSIFSPLKVLNECTLMAIQLLTGRMHQARVHAASIGNPVAGDWRYGDSSFNQRMKKLGLQRLFLHAESLRFQHPHDGKRVEVRAALPGELAEVLEATTPH